MPQSSFLERSVLAPHLKRDVKKVPFVELADQRLQGIVSSGSDIERVYVAYFEVGTLNYSCSTNNNRPCGGLRGSPCNHLQELLEEGITQFGLPAIVHFLQVPNDPPKIVTLADLLRSAGRDTGQYGNTIFSRFLNDLELLELPIMATPLPALMWFNE